MKRITLSIFMALTFIATAQSQKFKFGVNAGATYSGFRGMNVVAVDYKYGFGFMAGISAEYYLKERLSIKANLSYDRKSNRGKSFYSLMFNYDDPAYIYDQTITNNYDYLTLPIMAKYDFGKGNRFFINGGLFLGYLMQSETRSSSTSESNINLFYEKPISTTDLNKRLDYGFSVGLGKSFRLSEKNDLVVEIRDNLGMANTNDFPGGLNIKTNSLNLIVGWSFQL